jgi:hypothetical protein
MSCPHYVDFTRTCIRHFPRVLEYSSYTVCESEDYQNCLAYIALKTGFLCPFHLSCLEDLTTGTPIIVKYLIENEKMVKLFKSMAHKYCTSEENHRQCACFKLYEKGIHPPTELLPDGRKMRLRDLIFKRELTIE